MSEFNPGPNATLMIGGYEYIVKPHPSVPAFAFGQEGRKAFVYQLGGGPSHELYALKKFKPAYRVPELVEVCDSLARFSQWRGLEVCWRQCLHQGPHDDALAVYPDLEYAVLMPWIVGSTWWDIMVSETPLSRFEALTFANGTAQVLASIEEAGLAHCDIAAPNIIINANTGRAHLIDVEDLYAPGFTSPAALPAGTEGYAHQTAGEGLWKATGDRFAGAVIMAEMAAWFDSRIRKQSDEEHYFGANEMQQDVPRYQLIREVLDGLHADLAELFDAAWFSETLEDCPPLKMWGEVINEVHHRESLAKVVSDWQPIVVPGVDIQHAEPRPISTTAPELRTEPAEQPQPIVAKAAPTPAPAPSQPAVTIPPSTPLPPAPAIKPPNIHVPTSGGPVVEWVPLMVPAAPQPAPQPQSNGGASGNRPIMPPAPPVQAEALEPTIAAPPPIRVESQPTIIHKAPELEEEASDTIQPERDEVLVTGVKPVLDLSHIDRRNRPFLVWSETPHATGYQLQEADNPDFQGGKEFKVKAQETKWHPHWGRSGRLFYRVRALVDNQIGPWSDTLSLRIGGSK